jgi:hypothetical protein
MSPMRLAHPEDFQAIKTMPVLRGTEETGPIDPPEDECPNPNCEYVGSEECWNCPYGDDPNEDEPTFDSVEEAKGGR